MIFPKPKFHENQGGGNWGGKREPQKRKPAQRDKGKKKDTNSLAREQERDGKKIRRGQKGSKIGPAQKKKQKTCLETGEKEGGRGTVGGHKKREKVPKKRCVTGALHVGGKASKPKGKKEAQKHIA